jgi:hypothetical protein
MLDVDDWNFGSSIAKVFEIGRHAKIAGTDELNHCL